MWEMYDALIGGIPLDLTADHIFCGYFNTIVANRLGAGSASCSTTHTRLPIASGSLIGKPLREVAGLVKSWNMPEASIGHAAINSYYNSPEICGKTA
jgi:hypothetical protein